MKIIDSKLWEVGTKIYDLIIINLLWMIFSIPLITIGPATYAGLECIKDIENRRDGNIFISFLRYFKKNFLSNFLGFNTFLGILVVFLKLLIHIHDTQNIILMAFCIFIILESIFAMNAIFNIKEKDTIDLIVKSVVYGNKNILKTLVNLVLCSCVLCITISVPILMLVCVSLCMMISYKVLPSNN